MSIWIETVLTMLEAYPYVLIFPLVLVESPISTISAGLMVAAGLVGWPVAFAERPAPGPLASLVLLALVPFVYLMVARKALSRGPKGATQNPTRTSSRRTTMKILIANDTYPPDINSAAYFTRRLAEGLDRWGHEAHVLAASTGRRTGVMMRDGVVEHRLRSVPLPFHMNFRFSRPPFLYRRVLAEVKSVRPDVVHAQGHFFIGRAVIRAAGDLGIPVVATNHFMPDNLVFYLGLPGGAEKTLKGWAWRDFARVFNRADVGTAPTPFAARLTEEKGVRDGALGFQRDGPLALQSRQRRRRLQATVRHRGGAHLHVRGPARHREAGGWLIWACRRCAAPWTRGSWSWAMGTSAAG